MPQEDILDKIRREYKASNPIPEQEDILDKIRRENAARKPVNPAAPIEKPGIIGSVSGFFGGPSTGADVDVIKDRVKNIARILSVSSTQNAIFGANQNAGIPMDSSAISPAQKELIAKLQQGTDLKQQRLRKVVGTDIPNMFSAASAKESIDKFLHWKGWHTEGAADSSAGSTLGMIASLPVNMITSITADLFKFNTGLDINGKEVGVLQPEEVDAAIKATIGNVVGAVAGGVAHKLAGAAMVGSARMGVGAARLAPGATSLAVGGTTEAIAQGAAYAPQLGVIGRAIVQDASAAAAGGMAQGAVANANTPEAYSAMIQGLMFAPIGVIFGWYRGVKVSKGTAMPSMVDTRIDDLMRDANEIHKWRQIQELSDANVESLTQKYSDLLSVDKIEDAIVMNRPSGKELGNDIDGMYDSFKATLNDDKTFHESVIDFAAKHQMADNIPELTKKFAFKFMDEDPLAGKLKEAQHAIELQRQFGRPAFKKDILDIADKHSMYVTNEFGALKIRDMESGDIVGVAKTTAEAIEFMEKTGDHPQPVAHDAGSGLPTPPSGIKPPISQPHLDGWEPERYDHGGHDYLTTTDLKFANMTSMNARLDAIDRINRGTAADPVYTNFGKVFREKEHSHRVTQFEIKQALKDPKFLELNNYLKKNKFTETELEIIGHWLETESHDNLLLPGGYAKDPSFKISQKALDLKDYAHQNGVDLTKVLQYRRAVTAIKSEAINAAEQAADINKAANIKAGWSADQAKIQFWRDRDNLQGVDEQIAILQKRHGMDSKEFLQTNTLVDELYKEPNSSAQIQAATRLKLSLDHPDMFGLTRDEFALKNNLRPEIISAAQKFEAQFDDWGRKFGINDSRMLMRYMNHYRQYGDLFNDVLITDFEHGIMDPSMKKFASSMIRTGEVTNYSMNPMKNLQSYIRGGVKSQNIYETINELNSLELPKDKLKVTTQTELRKITNQAEKEKLKIWLRDYDRDITGQVSLSEKDWQKIEVDYLKRVGVSDADIIAEIEKPNAFDTAVALNSAALLGGRVSLAMRDVVDMWQKFYWRHGAKRLGQVIGTKVSPSRIAELERQGEIVIVEGSDVYNITHNNLGSLAKKASDLGYKASGQHYTYVRNQVKIYDHTLSHTNQVLGDMEKGIIKSKEAAYKKLFLNSYSVNVQKMFDAAVKSNDFGHASRILAREEVRDMAGYFTKGNQAPIMNSKPGRLFGQLGSWGMTNRSTYQNLISRGTKEELRGVYTRMGISSAAIMLTGSAAGVNLGRWMLLPTSLITTGGPVLGAIQSLGSAVGSNLGGSESQSRFTNRALSTAATQFIPGSYLAKDIGKAIDLVQHGEGYGVSRPLMQVMGISTNKEDRTWLDIAIGNYPVKWPDPTPFNLNPLPPSVPGIGTVKPFNPNPF